MGLPKHFTKQQILKAQQNTLSNRAAARYATDELTLAKGRELGLNPYAGESFAQFRARISAKISSSAIV